MPSPFEGDPSVVIKRGKNDSSIITKFYNEALGNVVDTNRPCLFVGARSSNNPIKDDIFASGEIMQIVSQYGEVDYITYYRTSFGVGFFFVTYKVCSDLLLK